MPTSVNTTRPDQNDFDPSVTLHGGELIVNGGANLSVNTFALVHGEPMLLTLDSMGCSVRTHDVYAKFVPNVKLKSKPC